MEQQSERIVKLIKKRKPEALEMLMDLHINSVFGVAKAILGELASPEDIEECVQDVFVEAWNNIGKFNSSRGSLKTWLLIICKYKALNIKKSVLRDNSSTDLESIQVISKENIEENFLLKEKKEQVIAVINNFESTDKSIFIRRYLLEQSVESIACALSMSRQAVDNRLWRGRKRLRDIFDSWERGNKNEQRGK